MRPRLHSRHPGALCDNVAAIGPATRLAAYRVEPVRTIDGPRHFVDLTLTGPGDLTVVAGIVLDLRALADHSRSPFVAPGETLVVADRLGTLCDALRAPLAATFGACGDPAERLVVVDAASEQLMADRRRAGALGAAPYAAVARARGREVPDGAYVESCLGAGVPPPCAPAAATTFGAADAPLRCYVALSDDALAVGGAAYQTALAVAAALAGDDVSVDVAGYDGRPLDAYAFVHVVGLDDPHAARDLIAQARARGVRALLTPLFDDPAGGGFWGARTHARAAAMADDDEMHAALSALVVQRKIELIAGVLPDQPCEPRPGYRDAARAAIANADGVFVTCAAEAQALRAACGADRAFAAYVPIARDVAAPDPSAPPYVLVPAPVGPLHASLTIARAAARVGFPVRFSGSVADGGYAARALSHLDARSALTPGDPGTGARVVADLSWTGTDLETLAAYAAHGVPVVASSRSAARDVLGATGVRLADPADERAIAAALADAWNAGGRHAAALSAATRARCRADVLRACLVKGYLPAEGAA